MPIEKQLPDFSASSIHLLIKSIHDPQKTALHPLAATRVVRMHQVLVPDMKSDEHRVRVAVETMVREIVADRLDTQISLPPAELIGFKALSLLLDGVKQLKVASQLGVSQRMLPRYLNRACGRIGSELLAQETIARGNKILVCEDQQIYYEGIQQSLDALPNAKVVPPDKSPHSCPDGVSLEGYLIPEAKRFRPDLYIVDLHLQTPTPGYKVLEELPVAGIRRPLRLIFISEFTPEQLSGLVNFYARIQSVNHPFALAVLWKPQATSHWTELQSCVKAMLETEERFLAVDKRVLGLMLEIARKTEEFPSTHLLSGFHWPIEDDTGLPIYPDFSQYAPSQKQRLHLAMNEIANYGEKGSVPVTYTTLKNLYEDFDIPEELHSISRRQYLAAVLRKYFEEPGVSSRLLIEHFIRPLFSGKNSYVVSENGQLSKRVLDIIL